MSNTTKNDKVWEDGNREWQRERTWPVDGRLHRPDARDLVPGCVLRMVGRDGSSAAFSDCIVVDVYPVLANGTRCDESAEAFASAADFELVLSRPYCRVQDNMGARSVLTGHETFKVLASRVTEEHGLFRVVVMSTGKAASFLLT